MGKKGVKTTNPITLSIACGTKYNKVIRLVSCAWRINANASDNTLCMTAEAEGSKTVTPAGAYYNRVLLPENLFYNAACIRSRILPDILFFLTYVVKNATHGFVGNVTSKVSINRL